MNKLTHFNQAGEAHMVDVGEKASTERLAYVGRGLQPRPALKDGVAYEAAARPIPSSTTTKSMALGYKPLKPAAIMPPIKKTMTFIWKWWVSASLLPTLHSLHVDEKR